jgi:hypothetical protein
MYQFRVFNYIANMYAKRIRSDHQKFSHLYPELLRQTDCYSEFCLVWNAHPNLMRETNHGILQVIDRIDWLSLPIQRPCLNTSSNKTITIYTAAYQASRKIESDKHTSTPQTFPTHRSGLKMDETAEK